MGMGKPFQEEEFSPWQTSLGGFKRLNLNSETLILPPDSRWSRKLAKVTLGPLSPAQHSSPVLFGGVVYAGSSSGGFYGYSLLTSRKVLDFETEEAIEGTATVTDEYVCFGTAKALFYCLDRATGIEVISFQISTEIASSPIVQGDTAYFTSTDNRLFAVDIATRKKLWSVSRRLPELVKTRLVSSPALSGDMLFTVFSDGHLIAVDKNTGKVRWTKEVFPDADPSAGARHTPTIIDDLLYIIDGSGALLAIDAATGATKVRYDVTKAIDFVVAEDAIFVVGSSELISISRRGGEILWTKTLTKGEAVSILSAGKYILVLSNKLFIPFDIEQIKHKKGFIEAYTMEKGALVWTKKLRSTITARASAAGGYIALLLDNASLTVLNAR